MRILFLSRWFPVPQDNGSRIRIWKLLAGLGSVHDVDLFAFSERPVESAHLDALHAHCRSVDTVPYCRRPSDGLWGVRKWAHSRPRSLVESHSPAMLDRSRRLWQSTAYDLVIASQFDMIPYAAALPHTPRLLEELELARIAGDQEDGAHAGAMRTTLTRWKLGQYVRRMLPRFAATTVVSEVEAGYVRRLVPGYAGELMVLPNGAAMPAASPAGGRPAQPSSGSLDLIYTGSVTYDANLDAVQYFAHQILPLIRREEPAARFQVTGATGHADLEPLRRAGAEFTGYVPDVGPLLAGATICVVPLRLGGGTRLKVLEALAAGVPVVATRKGIEGLDLAHGKDVLVADSPVAFAQAVVRLARDPALRVALAAQGMLAAQQYDWRQIQADLLALVERTAHCARGYAARRPRSAARPEPAISGPQANRP